MLLKEGIQHLMDGRAILFEKTPSMESISQDVSVTTIFGTLVRITSEGPVKITAEPRVAPQIITAPGPIQYSSD